MKIVQKYCTKNPCYKQAKKITPKGLMLHSVGCPQPKASVFVDTWNKAGASVAVHAVLQADGTIYQCLPWNYRGWHCGGTANNTHIGIEMTEPDCIKYTKGSAFTCSNKEKAREHATGAYNAAVALFAKLCKEYNLDPLKDVVSHKEGNKKGVASNHADPEHLWKGLGLNYTMDGFRKAVKNAMATEKKQTAPLYRVQVGAFSSEDRAKNYIKELEKKGVKGFIVKA